MRKLSFLLSLSLVLALVGCSFPTSGDQTTDKLVFAPNTDAQTLDPQHMNDNTSEQVIRMLYNGLLKFNEKQEIVGDLAKSWEVSKNGKVWTFKLKKGVKFQDGEDFNAEAVKKSFDRFLNKDNGLAQYQSYEMIKEVKVIDDYTVSFTTKEPFGAFKASMANTSGGIISPKAIEAYGKNLGKTAKSSVGGTGPYKVVEWKKDEQIVLERFEDYFGKKGVTKTIVYKPIPEAASRVMALETGEVDVIQQIPAKELKRLESVKGIEITKLLGNNQRQFRFDVSKKPFNDTRVRQAVSYAIDRQSILDNVVPGLGELSTSALAKVTWGYTDLGSIPYDPEKAKKLLAEAGYPNGFKTKITTTERYIQGVELAEALAAQLKNVGIEATIDVKEWSEIVKEWGGVTPDKFNQGIFIMGAAPSTMDADKGMRPIYATAKTNVQNYGFYSNKEFDDVIYKAMKEIDPNKRKALYKRAQEIVYLEDPVAFWLYDQYVIVAKKDKVKEVTVSPLTLITFEKAYIEK
ncbi:ABC transporter substrate-binding protein [Fictibacillus sp. WQ 8-8]|uniref:ABC transporter substrate-binding protein n=1 Tax=Fictibacillus sp. WQ 8-8 TaxID=2938788 RepID=UPI00210E06C4|nr:ABC transporter substrate-binding protein [Fictibacillus sp. WQ 8-8]MCQ6266326.1 ABC transporter substrate-binding protein [Fictibacillus sp. WQ 8-8]